MARKSRRSRKSSRKSRKSSRKLSSHRLNSLVKLATKLGLNAVKGMKKSGVVSKLRRSGVSRYHKSRRTTRTSRKPCKSGSYRYSGTSRCRKRGRSHKKSKY